MIFPQTHDHMGWRIGDHGFQMSLSPQLPDVVQQHAGPWLAQWLAREGLALHDVQGWAVHPGGPSILTACERALGLGSHSLVASRAVLAKHGNMSSPTVLFVLEELLRTGQQLPIVLLSFGPGVAAEAMLLR
jgi:predicted naringenin-chalcone synthase